MKLTLALRQTLCAILLVANCVSAASETTPTYAWRNFSGQPGGAGNADGTGTRARFNSPSSTAVDAEGNVYVADTFNHTIRKVSSSGVVITFAGAPGQVGSADGIGSAARFSSPTGVAVDGAGNVYVADTYNNTIRKITSGGEVTTLAGSAGKVGTADGTNATARFNEPTGVAVNNFGEVFVADSANSTIRKLTSAGVVTTLAGTPGQFGNSDGTNTSAQFSYPAGVTVDSSGNVYVADLNNSTIRKVTSGGVVTTLAGSAGATGDADGTNTVARFNYPSDVTVDNTGNLYVADTFNSTIRKISSAGVVTTLAGSSEQIGSADGTNSAALFNFPSGITVDAAGDLFVADTDNSTLRKVTSTGSVTTLAGSPTGAGSDDAAGSRARFNTPFGIARDSAGNSYVADTMNHTLRKVTPSGLVSTIAGAAGQPGSADATGSAARFNRPYAVAADTAGNLYVADAFNHTIRKVTSAGDVTTLAGSAGQSGSADGTNSFARFSSPTGVTTDQAGNVYVADSANHTLRKITSTGVVTTLAGNPGQSGSNDGTNSTARFSSPFGVATDNSGNIFVTENASHTVRKVTSAGVVTTLAGSAGQFGSNDGTNSTARFFAPAGIATDANGNLYIADLGNSTIRKITSTGGVTTLAGSAGLSGNTDGNGSAARFFIPAGVAADSGGNLIVADALNHTVRAVTTAGEVTTLAGGPGHPGTEDVDPAVARFFSPSAVTTDSAGNLFVADTYNHTIRKVASDGVVTTLVGFPGSAGSANGVGGSARFSSPFGIAVDAAGNLFIADTYNHTIRKVTGEKTVTTLAGSPGLPGSTDGTNSTARFSDPSGLAVDASGNIYVADTFNHTVRKVTSNGAVTTLAGSAGHPGNNDGLGTAALFNTPNGIAVDIAGNIYVADSGNSTIRMVSSTGTVTTIAGSAGQIGSADGVGSAARFDFPFGVTMDGAGNLYVADAGNSTIRKITSNGLVTTIGGFANAFGGADGEGNAAHFAGPSGIAVNTNGWLYVADAGNNRISCGIAVPNLSIFASGNGIVLKWPSATPRFVLQESSHLSHSKVWSNAGYSISDNGTNRSITIPSPATNGFFRLNLN